MTEEDVQAGEEAGADVSEPVEPTAEELRAQALEEIEQLRVQARTELEKERSETLEAARQQGYEEGVRQGRAEADDLKKELEARKQRLEEEYASRVEEM